MEYKINDICNSLNVGKSTIYKKISIIKSLVPETEWKRNEYFYYTDNNKLFITEKGFEFIKQNKNKKTNFKQNSTNNDNIRQNSNDIIIYQNQIIEMYKQENEYLKQENKRLLDIISVKEQKEIAKDIKYINSNNVVSIWDKLFNKFKKS